MNVLLPPLPDREALLGFRVALSVGAGLAGTVLVTLLAFGGAFGAAAGAVLAACVFLLLSGSRERMAAKLYERWNRFAAAYARRALKAVTAIWYWTVFLAVARTGEDSLDLAASAWCARTTLPPEGYADPGGAPSGREAQGGLRDLARWAGRSGRPWALVLLPFFALLRALRTKGRAKVSADIYTLY
jgi:hypothetical protein